MVHSSNKNHTGILRVSWQRDRGQKYRCTWYLMRPCFYKKSRRIRGHRVPDQWRSYGKLFTCPSICEFPPPRTRALCNLARKRPPILASRVIDQWPNSRHSTNHYKYIRAERNVFEYYVGRCRISGVCQPRDLFWR